MNGDPHMAEHRLEGTPSERVCSNGLPLARRPSAGSLSATGSRMSMPMDQNNNAPARWRTKAKTMVLAVALFATTTAFVVFFPLPSPEGAYYEPRIGSI